MKKIILALTVFSLLFSVQVLAATYSNGLELSKVVAVKVPKINFDKDCLVSSLTVRNKVVSEALAKKNDIILNALNERSQAIVAAYGLTTTAEINRAINTAQLNFKNTRNRANLDYKKATNAAWLKFNADRKRCSKTNNIPGEPTVNGQTLDLAL